MFCFGGFEFSIGDLCVIVNKFISFLFIFVTNPLKSRAADVSIVTRRLQNMQERTIIQAFWLEWGLWGFVEGWRNGG